MDTLKNIGWWLLFLVSCVLFLFLVGYIGPAFLLIWGVWKITRWALGSLRDVLKKPKAVEPSTEEITREQVRTTLAAPPKEYTTEEAVAMMEMCSPDRVRPQPAPSRPVQMELAPTILADLMPVTEGEESPTETAVEETRPVSMPYDPKWIPWLESLGRYRRNNPCPQCGSDDVALLFIGHYGVMETYLYGLQSAGLIKLGGCFARGEDLYCNSCGKEYIHYNDDEVKAPAPDILSPEACMSFEKHHVRCSRCGHEADLKRTRKTLDGPLCFPCLAAVRRKAGGVA